MTSVRCIFRNFSSLRIGFDNSTLHVNRLHNGVSNVFWRRYSMYPPTFQNPIYKKSDLEKAAESGVDKELQFTPIKAALTTETSSVFHDPIIRKFTNYVMKTGQRTLARELMTQTFEQIKCMQLQKKHRAETEEEKMSIDANPVNIFHQAVENCRPVLHLTPVKRGGIKYQVPVPLTEKRSYFVAMRWLVDAGREKFRTVHFPEKLAKELIEAARNEGRVVKKKQDLHRQCEANRAYAHYRWS